MKVFVYKKDGTNKCIDVVKNVHRVDEFDNTIYIYFKDGVISYPTKYVKTRIYQN